MNEPSIVGVLSSSEDYAVERLHYWLNYQTKTIFIGGGLFWLPFGPIFLLLTIVAFLFAPYMMWRLAQAGWYKTLILFICVVIAPLVAAQFVNPQNQILNYALMFGPMLAFYLFTWILKFVLGDQVDEIKGNRLFAYEEERARINKKSKLSH